MRATLGAVGAFEIATGVSQMAAPPRGRGGAAAVVKPTQDSVRMLLGGELGSFWKRLPKSELEERERAASVKHLKAQGAADDEDEDGGGGGGGGAAEEEEEEEEEAPPPPPAKKSKKRSA